MGVMLAKGRLGERWRRLFTGDPEGARCGHHLPTSCSSPASYTLTELKNEVILEMHVCMPLGSTRRCVIPEQCMRTLDECLDVHLGQ